MLKLYGVAALVLFAVPALAAECPITTNSNSVLRQAPGAQFAQIGTIPAGTALPVTVCFDRGAFCAVSTDVGKGFISGDLLAVPSGATLKSLESARWAKIDAGETAGPAAYDRCNIVVWGDSLSAGTFGPDLSRLLARDVSMQGVAGQTGAEIAARMLPDIRHDGRIVVLWDRHWTSEGVEQFMAELAPMVEKARSDGDNFVILSTIANLNGFENLSAEADAADTLAINTALGRQYPGNYLDVTATLADPSTRSDGLHLTPAGNAAVAGAIASYIQQRDW